MPTHAIARPQLPLPAPTDLVAGLWTRGVEREHGFQPLRVEGVLPADLRGTLVRNGPGLFEQFGRRYSHPFEADGALTALRLDGRGAAGAVRITESAGLREERRAGRLLYGLAAPWHRRVWSSLRGRVKNTANTNVLAWQGRLFALMEAAPPTEIDPRDLSVIGETDLDGLIVGAFSAHPHRVASRRATYNFGLEYGRKTRLHLYELPDEGAPRRLTTLDLAGPPMLHDFIATETHLVLFVAPVRVNVPRMLLALGDFRRLFDWRPQLGTEVICVPIDRPGEPIRFAVDPFYQWHFANAFDREGSLIIDYVRYPDFSTFYAIGDAADGTLGEAFDQGRYHRATVDLARRTLRSEVVLDRTCEFPRVHPDVEGREHRSSWIVLDDLSAIGRLDASTGALVTHALPAHQRASEPVFVPRAGARDESDGHVLVLCADGATDKSFLAIYDGRRLPEGPVARIWLDHRVPITFHGTWMPAVSRTQ